MKFKSQILCGLLLACLGIHAVHADPIPKDKVASGKIDDIVCGIKVTDGNLKTSEAKLGKGKFAGKDELTKSYRWNKGGLQIEIFYSKDDGSIKRVDLKGADTAGVCKTGRGLQLGQTLDDTRKLYGRFYNEEVAPDGAITAVAVWSENEDLFVNMWFQKDSHKISKIEVQYMLE